ncbi:leucyl aminopeptidase [Streptomyces sp. RKAG293]|uniref:leucyl aminopeptidase n=1 Tax=Streptomyces sp. RKAG293 TaxID=2893403 RepID=UPI0020344A93|nr:leucyl aminopeptidase [Streptomyces sp. RKAG293]MCM2417350.1 leucyl aminopeptidase [Streptomyces sp. RKAG293]
MSLRADTSDPVPSLDHMPEIGVVAAEESGPGAGPDDIWGMPVAEGGELPADVGLTPAAAGAAGFTGRVGQTLVCAHAQGTPVVLYGIGDPQTADPASLRDAAAAFALAAGRSARLTLLTPVGAGVDSLVAAQALVEGTLLARYAFEPLKSDTGTVPVRSLTLVVPAHDTDAADRGARRGGLLAKATLLARDLANSPPNLLTATRLADCATRVGALSGLDVEVFDQDALRELGCGGLLGVNAGSTEPARMIKLTYRPPAAGPEVPRLALVGKGITYDSGGISLKPADAVHATMKNDMSGAGAILAAMSVLSALHCPTFVTGYLMCTDNMPSGSATKLGDVLTLRGGTTVEVLNTDAEGRLVMADALVLATEEPTDAVVDIATLTGASLRALGPQIAAVFGNAQPLVDQVLEAARRTDEPVWQLPLARRYRGELDSDVADLKNIGGPNGGAIHAALFLEEFVAGRAWAHIDIAGTAQNDTASSWRPRGCTGFGARLLTELALGFTREPEDS